MSVNCLVSAVGPSCTSERRRRHPTKTSRNPHRSVQEVQVRGAPQRDVRRFHVVCTEVDHALLPLPRRMAEFRASGGLPTLKPGSLRRSLCVCIQTRKEVATLPLIVREGIVAYGSRGTITQFLNNYHRNLD